MSTPENTLIVSLLNKHISKLEKKKNGYEKAIKEIETGKGKMSKSTKTLQSKIKTGLKKDSKMNSLNNTETYL